MDDMETDVNNGMKWALSFFYLRYSLFCITYLTIMMMMLNERAGEHFIDEGNTVVENRSRSASVGSLLFAWLDLRGHIFLVEKKNKFIRFHAMFGNDIWNLHCPILILAGIDHLTVALNWELRVPDPLEIS